MSELSNLLIQNGYTIESEVNSGSNSLQLKAYYNDDLVMIDFTPGKSLLLSAGDEPGWEQLLDLTRPICTQFMGAEPICAYDAMVMVANMHYLDWYTVCPQRYLYRLVNRIGDFALANITNLQLFGDYKLDDFVDVAAQQACAEADKARAEYNGVYGKDPATCDMMRLVKADELGLFLEYVMTSSSKQDFERRLQQTSDERHDLFAFLMRRTALRLQIHMLELELDYIINAICRKVGIALLSEPSDQHRLQFDQIEFTKWYNFYAKHLQLICPSQKALGELAKKYQLNEDISAYAPAGNWRAS